MTGKLTVAVQGARGRADIPDIEALDDMATFRFATDAETLADALDGAEVLLGWDFSADVLERCWDRASALRWIQWTGAGVDAVLFPALVESDVVLTNARGIFDRPMAEYALGLLTALAKRLPETLALQRQHRWEHRLSDRMHGRRAVVVGVGSIGREIARVLTAFGLEVTGVGRSARTGDPDFGTVHAAGELPAAVADADYVVLIAPLTPETRGLFGRAAFDAMKPTAHFVNLGRGALVDEAALLDALGRGGIAGAALDVFAAEPLPADSPFWDMENVIVSPHMSGDFNEFEAALSALFADNLRRYVAGEPLRNVVDKRLGFVAAS